MTARHAVGGLPVKNRTLVIGVVNVTPDSFSDGGRFFDHNAAIAHGLDLAAEGADLVDVGGESTRPGANRPDEAEELRRVVPVVRNLAAAGVVVSVDTMRPAVARAAVEGGARLVNDVSGGQADPGMLSEVAGLEVPYVCMHWRGHSATMQSRARYSDVAGEVRDELGHLVDRAVAAGIARDLLVLDPGLGFSKTGEHNWALLAHLDRLDALGLPLLVGASRKAFLGTLLAGPSGPDLTSAGPMSSASRPTDQRDDATVALTTLLAWRGVWAVRTHTVRPHRDAIAVVERLRQEK